MAGAGLIVIKRRIKSVTNTKKITKAMGLVASSKLRKVREKSSINNEYYNYLEEIKNMIVKSMDDNSNFFIKGNGKSKKLYVIFTSDSGLCGGYNVGIIGKALEEIKKDKEESLIMVLGQKGREYLNRFNYTTEAEYVELSDIPNANEAKTISEHIGNLFKCEKVGEVYLVYTKFVSSMKQDTVVEKFLPLDLDDKNQNDDDFIFEPEKEEILEDMISMYLKSKILNCLMSAKTSEHSARMTAMDGASRNADDILEKLNIKYNRVRQSVITQEISEIVGGAEAQK